MIQNNTKINFKQGRPREPKMLAGGEYKNKKINKKGQTGPAQGKSSIIF